MFRSINSLLGKFSLSFHYIAIDISHGHLFSVQIEASIRYGVYFYEHKYPSIYMNTCTFMSVNRIMITSSTIILIYIEHTLNYTFSFD